MEAHNGVLVTTDLFSNFSSIRIRFDTQIRCRDKVWFNVHPAYLDERSSLNVEIKKAQEDEKRKRDLPHLDKFYKNFLAE